MNECLYIFVWKAAEFFYLHDHVLFLLIPKIFLKLSKMILLALIPVSLKTYTIIPSPDIQSPPSSSKYCYVFFFFFFGSCFLEEFLFILHFTTLMSCHLFWQFLALFLSVNFVPPFNSQFLIPLISL